MQLAGTSGPDGHVGRGFNGAVGSPDTLDPVPEGPEAHCDNADFIDSVALGLDPPYPQSRATATKQLQVCIDHLRERFEEGIDAAKEIVNDYGRISERHVDLGRGHCTYSFPDLHWHIFGRSKCSAIEGFGRALHGVQDFYAHSNWADDAVPPFGPNNPPGLKRDDIPSFLDLRAQNDISAQVPYNLSTGCFSGILTDGAVGQPGHPLEPGSSDCTGRITHFTLNKDNGIIDPVTGRASDPGPNTPRSNLEGNFQRAVSAAIKDSRRQWMFFREDLRRLYDAERGNMMICAILRDQPTIDCYGRRVVILRDSTAAQVASPRTVDLQMPNVLWLESEVDGHGHDESEGLRNATISESAPASTGWAGEMQVPLTFAAGGTLDVETELLSGARAIDFRSGVDILQKNVTRSGFPASKSAILALTNTRHDDITKEIGSIWQAGDYGFRVHLGHLPAVARSAFGPSIDTGIDGAIGRAKEEKLMTAVLRTGGTYSILHRKTHVRPFLEHVVSRGLTQLDNAVDTATVLPPGLTIADLMTAEVEPRRYSFDAAALHNAVVSVSPVSNKLALYVSLRHVRRNVALKSFVIGTGGNATFRAELGVHDIPRGDAWFELEIAHVSGDGLVPTGVFEVSLNCEAVNAEKEELPDDENVIFRHDS